MYKNLKIVKVDTKYCDYLRKYDNRVSYNFGTKELRPFLGVLFTVGDYEHFAPLASPKEKYKRMKNTLDLIKIKDGEYGVVNLNNMIPVNSNNYIQFDLNKKTSNVLDITRIELLNNQLRWLTSHKREVYTKSYILYNLYINNKLPKNVKDRCCNYPLLEAKCNNYNIKVLQEV